MSDEGQERLFETSYEEHRKAQLARWSRETTPAQRLQWLEDALAFAHAAGVDYFAAKRAREKRGA